MVIVNFDDTITICEIVEDDVYFDEVEVKRCPVFINRYLRYYINEKRVAQAQLFNFQGRINRITKSK